MASELLDGLIPHVALSYQIARPFFGIQILRFVVHYKKLSRVPVFAKLSIMLVQSSFVIFVQNIPFDVLWTSRTITSGREALI